MPAYTPATLVTRACRAHQHAVTAYAEAARAAALATRLATRNIDNRAAASRASAANAAMFAAADAAEAARLALAGAVRRAELYACGEAAYVARAALELRLFHRVRATPTRVTGSLEAGYTFHTVQPVAGGYTVRRDHFANRRGGHFQHADCQQSAVFATRDAAVAAVLSA